MSLSLVPGWGSLAAVAAAAQLLLMILTMTDMVCHHARESGQCMTVLPLLLLPLLLLCLWLHRDGCLQAYIAFSGTHYNEPHPQLRLYGWRQGKG